MEPLVTSEIYEVLKNQIMPELSKELLEAGDYGRGLLMGTIMFLIYENSKNDEAEEEA